MINVERIGNQDKDNLVKSDKADQNIFNPSSFSSQKEIKDKQKKVEVKADVFNCSKIDYKTKKNSILKKHITTKHGRSYLYRV